MPDPEGLPVRSLGRTDLEVSALIFGANVLGWTLAEPEAYSVLDAYVEAGGNMIDTADVYSNWAPGQSSGDSERIIGRWLAERGRPKGLLLTTKAGFEFAPGQSGLSRAHLRRSVEGSLDRLGVDRIDLFLAHTDDPSTPLEETLRALAELRDEGRIAHIGGSNYTGPRLEEALRTSEREGLPRFECLQTRYNLYDREPFESSLQATCVREGLGVTAFPALASGFLTGKYRGPADTEGRARGGRMRERYLNERGLRILDSLDQVAHRHATRPATVALAWLLGRPGVTAPIVSATSTGQLAEVCQGARLSLSDSDMAELDRASRP